MKHHEYMNSKTTKESATNKFLNAEPPKTVPNKATKQNGSPKSKLNDKNISTNLIRAKTSKREPAHKDNDSPSNSLPDKQGKAAILNKNTILVVGDSMINNIDEWRLGRRFRNHQFQGIYMKNFNENQAIATKITEFNKSLK